MTTAESENVSRQRSPTADVSRIDEDTRRHMGQMVTVIFEGLQANTEIRMMIEKYYVGSILLTRRNIQDVGQLSNLTQELQQLAKNAGYERPLMMGIDQENGMISRLGDGIRATHFPGSMALGAARSPKQAFDIAKATAKELAAVGINWNYAPCLDVVGQQGGTTIGVRSFGDEPDMVGKYGLAFLEGLRTGGVGHCAKHFPGIGSSREGRRVSVMTTKTREELEQTDLMPFRRAVDAGLETVMLSSSIWTGNAGDDIAVVGATHAKHVINDVLRTQLRYDGVTMCDVTDMPTFTKDAVGVAVVTAIGAGCDMVQIYHSASVQSGGVEAMYTAFEDDNISRSQIYRASGRIGQLKEHYLDWRTALSTPGPQTLPPLRQDHSVMARKAFEAAVTLVRDEKGLIPLSSKLGPKQDLLLLTPVVRPLHARAPGELPVDPFECLGRALARRHPQIRHAPYTHHGVTTTHVDLIKQAAVIVFVTVNASMPNAKSQIETAGQVQRLSFGKPMVNIAACDPYDLLDERKFGTYLCTYEYSKGALESAAAVIFGERKATGHLPVTAPGVAPPAAGRQHRQWFVEVWEKRKDLFASADLWKECLGSRWPLDAGTLSALLDRPHGSKHFVVRHRETQELLGFCATYVTHLSSGSVIGSLALLIVAPNHRNLGIGLSLHECAVRHLSSIPGVGNIQLGSIFPRFFPGIPTDIPAPDLSWFSRRAWTLSDDNLIYDLYGAVDAFTVSAADQALSSELAERGITINNCRQEQFARLAEFEERYFTNYPGWVEKYQALEDADDVADAIIAFDRTGILGAVLIYSPLGNNAISRDVPWPKVIGERVGGLGFVSVKPDNKDGGIKKGLIIAAISELRQRGLKGCFIDWADDIETYKGLGFQQWGKYYESWRKV